MFVCSHDVIVRTNYTGSMFTRFSVRRLSVPLSDNYGTQQRVLLGSMCRGPSNGTTTVLWDSGVSGPSKWGFRGRQGCMAYAFTSVEHNAINFHMADHTYFATC
jgi:hypothetical protein